MKPVLVAFLVLRVAALVLSVIVIVTGRGRQQVPVERGGLATGS